MAEKLHNSDAERVFVASIVEGGHFKQYTGLNRKRNHQKMPK